jgi:hypothetical protein
LLQKVFFNLFKPDVYALSSLNFNSLILSSAPATTSHIMVYKAPCLGWA